MNTFCLSPTDVPTTLYRVQYGDSMTAYDIHEGLEAADTVTFYDNDGGDEQEVEDTLQEFGDAVEQHLNWDTGYESMFISLFSQRRHAENWINCTLLQISTAPLNGFSIFRAEEIVDALSLAIPEAARASVAREYLIAHYIPPRAIIRSQTVDDILAGRNRRHRSILGPLRPSRAEDMASPELIAQLEAMGI
ncbi:uncharacterized protein BO97DRAFT_472436 [Aspergillus homomorphus CBS 101889]|uniref:DUF7587 domain-containing protein n=1 Tax=Aspergillus homomorphus (strain CBS 101889) TaxID=1450537 RepID=A0A395HQ22_ASPHC|nr:hypothetical protein BO97DRAFT_472436 [Aspergillus homomorphus CBS 101889]RAL09375.1 hypothetical protein BO97DRAFT_472436 [Aspergillus homomorphus CBS 101889]